MPIMILHGVRINESAQHGAEVEGAGFYDGTTGILLGPVFDTLEDLEDFQAWCAEHYTRGVNVELVMKQRAAWLLDRARKERFVGA